MSYYVTLIFTNLELFSNLHVLKTTQVTSIDAFLQSQEHREAEQARTLPK